MSISARRLFAAFLLTGLFFCVRFSAWAAEDAATTHRHLTAVAVSRTTTADTPISFALPALAAGTEFVLMPSAPGAGHRSVLVANEGIFRIDATGVLTFVPEVGFTGTACITYAVRDAAGRRSAPAIVSVTVGAE
mgnify:CR=1 FL=1